MRHLVTPWWPVMQERGAHSICVRFDCVFVNRRQASASCRRGPTAIASAVMCEKHAAGASRFTFFHSSSHRFRCGAGVENARFLFSGGQQKRGPVSVSPPCFCLVVQCVSGGQGTPVDLPHHPAYGRFRACSSVASASFPWGVGRSRYRRWLWGAALGDRRLPVVPSI